MKNNGRSENKNVTYYSCNFRTEKNYKSCRCVLKKSFENDKKIRIFENGIHIHEKLSDAENDFKEYKFKEYKEIASVYISNFKDWKCNYQIMNNCFMKNNGRSENKNNEIFTYYSCNYRSKKNYKSCRCVFKIFI